MIRQATPADALALASVGALSFYQAFAAQNAAADMAAYLAAHFTEEQLRKDLASPALRTYLALTAGEAAGYARLRKGEIPAAVQPLNALEIERLYVLQQHLGKGIGYRLMQQCLQAAEEQGYEAVWLGVWEHNHRAISFYQQLGFRQAGTHNFLLGSDLQTDLLLVKEL